MKTTQYVRQLKAIEAAETSGIRERWMFGLRLLRDPEVMTESGKSLKHGVAEQLIAAAGVDAKGKKRLNEQEIQRCIRCARAYPTEAQIRMAATDFGSWSEIVQAGFPSYDAPDGEPAADHRTEAERARDRARSLAALAEMDSDQLTLFPLDRYEPNESTLKELADYSDEMSAMTARFLKRDEQRREYVERLIEAAGGDMSATWQDAHRRAFGEDVTA